MTHVYHANGCRGVEAMFCTTKIHDRKLNARIDRRLRQHDRLSRRHAAAENLMRVDGAVEEYEIEYDDNGRYRRFKRHCPGTERQKTIKFTPRVSSISLPYRLCLDTQSMLTLVTVQQVLATAASCAMPRRSSRVRKRGGRA